MSNYIKKFEFKEEPREFNYKEGEPLDLTEEFRFYHNKLKFRKELTPLQYLFADFFNTTLQASAIRDSYIKKEYDDVYLMVIFSGPETIKNANKIIEKHLNISLNQGCYYMESTSDNMLLLSKDIEGIRSGVEKMREILQQVLDDYFERKQFDEFIKLRQFNLFDCAK
ncbi:MAG: hypothetical protein ACQERB_10525 [Promethearchaeati archaeon]